MMSLTKGDLKKLAQLCDRMRYADELVRDNSVDGADYSYGERCIAAIDADWMKSLSAKLNSISESGAKRIELV